MKAAGVLTERDVPNLATDSRLMAMFLVVDHDVRVFADTRKIEVSAAVAWAETLASDGVLVSFWFEGDAQPVD